MLNRVPLFPKSLVRFSSLHCVHAALLQRTLLNFGLQKYLEWGLAIHKEREKERLELIKCQF